MPDNTTQADDSIQADGKGFSLKLDWPTVKIAFKWLRTTIITLALGGGGWHGYTTEQRLTELRTELNKSQQTLKECAERLNRIEQREGLSPMKAGPGQQVSGPPTNTGKDKK